MNIKLLICAVVLFIAFLGLIFCHRRENRSPEDNDQSAKNNLRILAVACNEIWMFLYHRRHPGLDRMNQVEMQNIFAGVLLAITKDEACGLYAEIKQKLTQENDELQNQAYSLIIRELSRRLGC